MKIYFADTNFYLRFVLGDIKEQADKTEEFLLKAKEGKIKIIFTTAIIIEMAIVLEKYYHVTKDEIALQLSILVKSIYLQIEDRQIWIKTLEYFPNINIDLLDILLFEKAREEGAEVLTFDRDFKKLEKYYGKIL